MKGIVNIADKLLKSRNKKIREITSMLLDYLKNAELDKMILMFKNYLKQFHSYSINNWILILVQFEEPTIVAGMNKWNKLGRHVKKGEKAIWIFAPYKKAIHYSKYALKVELENGNTMIDNEITAIITSRMNGEERNAILDNLLEKGKMNYGEANMQITKIDEWAEEHIVGFIPVRVFDYTQTEECKKYMPCYLEKPFRIEEFKKFYTTGYNDNEFWDIVYKTSLSFVSDIKLKPLSKLESWQGFYVPATDTIVINEYSSTFDRASTLLHELSHYIVHKKLKLKLDRDFEEVVVELSSLILTWLYCEVADKHIDLKSKALYIREYMERGNMNEKDLLNAINIASNIVDMIISAVNNIKQ